MDSVLLASIFSSIKSRKVGWESRWFLRSLSSLSQYYTCVTQYWGASYWPNSWNPATWGVGEEGVLTIVRCRAQHFHTLSPLLFKMILWDRDLSDEKWPSEVEELVNKWWRENLKKMLAWVQKFSFNHSVTWSTIIYIRTLVLIVSYYTFEMESSKPSCFYSMYLIIFQKCD